MPALPGIYFSRGKLDVNVDFMGDIWLGAVITLSGVIVGAIATYLTQKNLWKHATLRELYGNFIGQSKVCHDRLMDVAYAIRRRFSEQECNDRWGKANAQMAEVSSLAAQLSMVAATTTRSAAEELEKLLSDLRGKLHTHHTDGTTPPETQFYLDRYNAVVGKFISAARSELRIAKN